MMKCSKRHRLKIMSLVMASSLVINLAGPASIVSAQENDGEFRGGGMTHLLTSR
ncbi:MAG: hypothetical protein NC489_41380 [Ruminococcus flavefaciens]|nr:hypothetical protein [Ruminococcus flavefaciens]